MYGLSCKEYVIITDNNCTETNLYLWHVTQATSTYLSRVLKTIVCKIITVQKSECTHSCFLCSGIQCKNHLLMRLLCIEYNKYYALDTYGTVWTNLCNSPNIPSSRSLMCQTDDLLHLSIDIADRTHPVGVLTQLVCLLSRWRPVVSGPEEWQWVGGERICSSRWSGQHVVIEQWRLCENVCWETESDNSLHAGQTKD